MKGYLRDYEGNFLGEIGSRGFLHSGVGYSVGDVVEISEDSYGWSYARTSIVVQNIGGVAYIYGYSPFNLCDYDIKKTKSFNQLKNRERYSDVEVIITDDKLSNAEIQNLLSKEDKQDLLQAEIELAVKANDTKTFDELTGKYNELSENAIDKIYEEYKNKYKDMKNKELTVKERMAYLELIMDYYFDLYGEKAKEHEDFLHIVEEYNKLSVGCVVR